MIRPRKSVGVRLVETRYACISMVILVLCMYFQAKGFFGVDVLFIAAVAFSIPILVIQFLQREANTLAILVVIDILILVLLVFEDFVL